MKWDTQQSKCNKCLHIFIENTNYSTLLPSKLANNIPRVHKAHHFIGLIATSTVIYKNLQQI